MRRKKPGLTVHKKAISSGEELTEFFLPDIIGIITIPMTAIWRKVAPSADAIAEQGLKFFKSKE